MASLKKRTALLIAAIALAAGSVALFRQSGNASPDGSTSEPALASAKPTEKGSPQSSPDSLSGAALSSASFDGQPAGQERRSVLGQNAKLNPYVALAVTTGTEKTEELCPEIANDDEQGGDPAARKDSKGSGGQGCVLPIGGETSSSVQQASMPIDRPPSPLARNRMSFLPAAGGLGAAIAAIPAIGAISNNDNDAEPVSPE